MSNFITLFKNGFFRIAFGGWGYRSHW